MGFRMTRNGRQSYYSPHTREAVFLVYYSPHTRVSLYTYRLMWHSNIGFYYSIERCARIVEQYGIDGILVVSKQYSIDGYSYSGSNGVAGIDPHRDPRPR